MVVGTRFIDLVEVNVIIEDFLHSQVLKFQYKTTGDTVEFSEQSVCFNMANVGFLLIVDEAYSSTSRGFMGNPLGR